MTRRERMEARAEKRREWAEGRASKAAALHQSNERFRGDVAFNTQPGHVPERARVIARTERAFEHSNMAAHHVGKAFGIEAQLDRSIFSDDPDAIEALEAKSARLDAKAEHENAINKAWQKHTKRGAVDVFNGTGEAIQARGDLLRAWTALGVSDALAASLLRNAQQFSWTRRRGPCDPTYARANARNARERIKLVQMRQERAEAAAVAGGVNIERRERSASVTFTEKPERAILEALREANYYWQGGSWHGLIEALPACVVEMEGQP